MDSEPNPPTGSADASAIIREQLNRLWPSSITPDGKKMADHSAVQGAFTALSELEEAAEEVRGLRANLERQAAGVERYYQAFDRAATERDQLKAALQREKTKRGRLLRSWWPPAIRAALYSWQQTADEQEWELMSLRGVVYEAQLVSDGLAKQSGSDASMLGAAHQRDHEEGLAASLARYREQYGRYRRMVDGNPRPSMPRGG